MMHDGTHRRYEHNYFGRSGNWTTQVIVHEGTIRIAHVFAKPQPKVRLEWRFNTAGRIERIEMSSEAFSPGRQQVLSVDPLPLPAWEQAIAYYSPVPSAFLERESYDLGVPHLLPIHRLLVKGHKNAGRLLDMIREGKIYPFDRIALSDGQKSLPEIATHTEALELLMRTRSLYPLIHSPTYCEKATITYHTWIPSVNQFSPNSEDTIEFSPTRDYTDSHFKVS